MEDELQQSDKKLFFHIGWGKCGTTWLQNDFFSQLQKHGLIEYNPINFIKNFRKLEFACFGGEQFIDLAPEFFAGDNLLLSYEGLVGAPYNFFQNYHILSKALPHDSEIIITIREPSDFLRSVYMQEIQTGNVIKPDDFFLRGEEFRKIKPFLRQSLPGRFNVDDFMFRDVISAYRDTFRQVHLIPYEFLKNASLWASVLRLDVNDIDNVLNHEDILVNKIYNLSYSKRATALTFKREHLLNCFNFKSISYLEEFECMAFDFVHPSSMPVTQQTESKNNLLYRLVKKIINTFRKMVSWQRLMSVMDRLLPYERYMIPNDLINTSSIRAASAYYKEVVTNIGKLLNK